MARSEAGIRLIIEGENRSRAAVNDFARDVRQGTQVMDAMSGEIVGRLNPALDRMVGSISRAAREARSLPGSFGAAVIGAAAISTALGVVVQRTHEAAEAQASLNIGLRSLDSGPAISRLKDLARQSEEFAEKDRKSTR